MILQKILNYYFANYILGLVISLSTVSGDPIVVKKSTVEISNKKVDVINIKGESIISGFVGGFLCPQMRKYDYSFVIIHDLNTNSHQILIANFNLKTGNQYSASRLAFKLESYFNDEKVVDWDIHKYASTICILMVDASY